jgi:hypothetical protein
LENEKTTVVEVNALLFQESDHSISCDLLVVQEVLGGVVSSGCARQHKLGSRDWARNGVVVLNDNTN